MKKRYLVEVQKLQKIAGLLKEEDLDLDFNPLGPERKKTIEYVVEKYKNELLKVLEDKKIRQINKNYWKNLRFIIEKMLKELEFSTEDSLKMIIVINDIAAGDYEPNDVIDYIKDFLILHKKFASTGF